MPVRHTRKRWFLAACALAGVVLPAAMLELTSSSNVPITPEPRDPPRPAPDVVPMSGRNDIAPVGPESETPPLDNTKTLSSVDEGPGVVRAEEPPRKSSRRKSSARQAGGRRFAAGAFPGKSPPARTEPQPSTTEPAVTAPAKTVAPESSTTVPQRLDAWNTDTFGGRR